PVSCAASTSGRALALRQLADDRLVRRIDRLVQLVVGYRAADLQRVPTGPAYVGHHLGVPRVPLEPLVGHLAVRAAFHADGLAGADEREYLAADLGDDVAFPRFVLPRARLLEAVLQQRVLLHDCLLRFRVSAPRDGRA